MADADNNENTEGAASADDDWAAAMAEQAIAESAPAASNAQPAQIFQNFGDSGSKASMLGELDMILDIPVQITVELGRTKLSIRNLLQLAHGSVVELDGLAGEPMDVLVNGTLIARGEIVNVDGRYGIQVAEVVAPDRGLGGLDRRK